jgi:hypothetical protein
MNEEQNNEANTAGVKLTDITRGLYHAAASTYSMAANQYISLLSQYFDETLEGTYVPKSVVVQLPDETTVNLPLISMVSPKGLMLDKVDFSFAVTADPSSLAEATTDLDGLNLTRSSFKVEMAVHNSDASQEGARKRDGVVDISMKFTAVEPPEGLMRLLDKFASIVTPVHPQNTANNYLPLLSPRFFFIAKALADDPDLKATFHDFNAVEFSPEEIAEKGEDVKRWEDELLAISVEIDQMKTEVADTVKETVHHAHIVFQGTDDYEKLKLSQKFSSRSREWVNQATQFYKTLLEDEGLAFKLAKLRHPEITTATVNIQWQNEYDRIARIADKVDEYDAAKTKPEYEAAKSWLQKFQAVAKILLKDRPAQLAKVLPDSEFLNK